MLRQAQHERGEGVHRLICHPGTPANAIHGITANIWGNSLSFEIDGPPPRIPPPAARVHTDELWRSTCFELFVKPLDGDAYFELNFSPSTAWAAYRFDRYREGMAVFPLDPPMIEPIEHGLRMTVDLSALPPPPWRVGLSAVIEEAEGTKSYWALAHPAGQPDFHHPDCFALTLPAA